jgi:hypothetical protein
VKTDQFIEILSADLEPVKRGIVGKALAWALIIGGAAAFGAMLVSVGIRPGLFRGSGALFLALKLIFTISLIGAGAAFLSAASHPGRSSRKRFLLAFLPFLAVALLGLRAVLLSVPAAPHAMVFASEWLTCLTCIPLFAVIPFAVLILALRLGAPTDLKRTGAIAGLVAGSVGAAAYAFHCSGDSLPFIAVWYGIPILLWIVIGALLGPRLLRW